MRLASNDLIKLYLDSNNIDSASLIINQRIPLEKMQMMTQLMMQNDTMQALNNLAVLNSYADSIQISNPEKASTLYQFHDFYQEILPVMNREGGYFNLSQNEMSTLRSISDSNNSMSAYARSILNFINKTYPYVDAYDADGAKSMTQQTEEETWTPLPEETLSLNLYPNPSTGIFDISLSKSDSQLKQIQVYNLEGKLLFESNATSNLASINLSDLNHGLYLLKVHTQIDNSEINLTKLVMIEK